MIPNKLLRVLGYNNLSIILMQERRHWLMKTSKNEQIQDSITGDIFQGRIDNTGADIILESKKLPYKYDFTSKIKFNLTHADEILDIKLSSLPHSACVNGLMYTIIKSSVYAYDAENSGNYKLRFTNAEECIIPFGASLTSSEVYAGKWIKTTTPPTLLVCDTSTGEYSISRTLGFNGATNVTWYYPLEESLQPINITKTGTTYTLDAVDNDNYIGDPLFWFTCDESNVGSNVTISNNVGSNNTQLIYISNEGNSSPYNAKLYVGIDGSDNATPDGSSITNYSIRVSPVQGRSFTNDSSDMNVPLSNVISFVNTSSNTTYTLTLTYNEKDVLTMCNDSEMWTYVDSSTYAINMDYFAINCYSSQLNSPLVALLNMTFDSSVPFVQPDPDYGFAGMRFYAGNPSSDTVERYPYNLNKWEGLPEWLTDETSDTVQEHGVVYAMHSTPSTDPENPETFQGAGLIFDPGLVEDPQEENPNSVGRVYVLSNDSLVYENNKSKDTLYPKPDRTAARICDIPTSAVQLTGAKGLSTTQVVDKKYVRTETSYSVSDKSMLYNDLASRWVKPLHLTEDGVPAYEASGLTNKFVFETVDELRKIDMYDHNNFRYTENLNPVVDVSEVSIGNIDNRGSGYAENDTGLVIVGGSSFTYTVLTVDEDGGVQTFSITPDEHVSSIPLYNFDMTDVLSGFTLPYGTSPLTGNGKGFRFSFRIDYDYLQSILPKKGEFFPDLFALVRENSGLFLYDYRINSSSSATPKEGAWVKSIMIAEFEVTDIDKSNPDYGVSTHESFVNSILPNVTTLPVTRKLDNVGMTSIDVLQTASCINVIDSSHTPVVPPMASDDPMPNNIVDLCKFYCDGISQEVADETHGRNVNGVISALRKKKRIRFDSYVIWRWLYPDSELEPNDGKPRLVFEYGIIHRGFSNLFSTDSTTKLPKNDLYCDNYVHFNAGTSIMWNVPGVGPMVWMYDPKSTKKEDYRIDPQTMDLEVIRTNITYADVDVRMNDRSEVVKIVEDGKYLWNILSNNPQNIPPSGTNPLYKDPELSVMSDVVVGASVDDTIDTHKMMGNWKLVFPRINTFVLSNDLTNTKYVPKKMNTIKSRNVNISPSTKAYDDMGNDVSAKTLVISETVDGTVINVYNSEAGRWDKI